MTKLSAEQLIMIRELKTAVRYDLARSLLDHIAAVEAERDALTRLADAVHSRLIEALIDEWCIEFAHRAAGRLP